jgi:hypothetical protein
MQYLSANFIEFMPDLLGIIGVLLVLWYYFLLQIGKCTSNSLGFSVGNFIGSILLLISLGFNWNLASVIIEIAWLLISLYGIIKYYTRSVLQRS